MLNKNFLVLLLTVLICACNSTNNKTRQANDNTINEKTNAAKPPYTSTHVFTATYEGTAFHKCNGLTANCPDKCGSSGNMATFKVDEYKEFTVNGEAGNEKLSKYEVLISDYYKKDLDKPYVALIKNLHKGDLVTIHVEYVYDTTKSVVAPVENLISITKNNNNNTPEETTNKNWWIGKHFISNMPASKNPEEGGRNFMTINSNNTADYKVGDIVELNEWSTENGKLILTNKMTNTKVIFRIESDYLIDEYGNKWTVEK